MNFFFFTFRKKLGRSSDGKRLLIVMNFEISNELMRVELSPRKIWKADFPSVRRSSAR